MKNEKIIHDYENTLNIGEYGEEFLEYYENETISDVIMYIAGASVDVYTDELWSWARYNKDAIEIAVESGYYSVNSSDFDLMDLFKAGQYESVVSDLYADLDDIMAYTVLEELQDEFVNIERLIEVIDDTCINIDNNRTIGYYIDIVTDTMEDYPMLEIHLETGTAWTESILVEGTTHDDILALIDEYYYEHDDLPVPMFTLDELLDGGNFKSEYEAWEYIDNLDMLPINGGEFFIYGISHVEEVI